jgi:hypothetical protein
VANVECGFIPKRCRRLALNAGLVADRIFNVAAAIGRYGLANDADGYQALMEVI